MAYKCSMQKKIESLSKKNEARHVEPRSKEDLVAALEKIREGWWTLNLGYGDFLTGPFGDMLNDIGNNDDEIMKYGGQVWGSSFDEIPMDEWCDAMIRAIKNYTPTDKD